MQIFRYATSIYGGGKQLIGANWDLIPWFAGIALVLCAVHMIVKAVITAPHEHAVATSVRIPRHTIADRFYHWIMAAAVFVLLGTAFLPLIGLRFEWLDAHWIAGVVLTVCILYHLVLSLGWRDWRLMAPSPSDIGIALGALRGKVDSPKPGKYNPAQKGYHSIIAALILAMIVTGLLMLTKIDTPFWRRNPYWMSNDSWAIVYIIHDFAALSILSLVIIHVYFALRPNEWFYLRSMIRGWIRSDEYSAHHDPERWPVVKRR